MTKISPYWAEMDQQGARFSAQDLAQFRSGGGLNDRFAAWNPRKRGMTFFKFFLNRLLADQNEDFFAAYAKIGATDLGNPPHIVRRHGQATLNIDFEYFMAVEELMFLRKAFPGARTETMWEIGAGFGRSCHCLIRNIPEIANYFIVDLPNIMKISMAYLHAVLKPEELRKVHFIDASRIAGMPRTPVDVVFSSNTFQSLEADVVRDYLKIISECATSFYLRDAVAKYRPEDLLGEESKPLDKSNPTAVLGLCHDVIDVFDQDALAASRAGFELSYRPSPDFRLVASAPVQAIPFYQHVAYTRV